jgi:Protein of unknown function (DUF1257)
VIETLIILLLLWATIKIIEFVLNPDKFLSWHYQGHFSQLRTQITDVEVLINTLQELGFSVETDAEVRGGSKPRRANVVAVLEGNCDIGFIENTNNNDETFYLIADLWGLSKRYKPAIIIHSIFDKYHELEAIKDALS